MKVAFVTPRYGPEVMGGAETAARQLAEHLVAEIGWDVEVFSTCTLDHITWEDVLEPGDSELNGVTVHRFVPKPAASPSSTAWTVAFAWPHEMPPGASRNDGSNSTARSTRLWLMPW